MSTWILIAAGFTCSGMADTDIGSFDVYDFECPSMTLESCESADLRIDGQIAFIAGCSEASHGFDIDILE